MNYTLAISPPIAIKFRLNLSLKIFWILALASIISLLILYIFQINSLTYEAYSVQSYEEKLSAFTQENKNMEINFSKASSLDNLESYPLAQNFEKVSQVKYIKILGSQVAAK